MRNSFFQKIFNKVRSQQWDFRRLGPLLSALTTKLGTHRLEQARQELEIMRRMVYAYARGHYRAVPWKTMLVVIAGFVYFIDPIDLIPDFIFIGGLVDDVTVLLWVYSTVRGEIRKFQDWEAAFS